MSDYYIPGEGSPVMQPESPDSPGAAAEPLPSGVEDRVLVEADAYEPEAAPVQDWGEGALEEARVSGSKLKVALIAIVAAAAVAIGVFAGMTYAGKGDATQQSPVPEPAPVISGVAGSEFSVTVTAAGFDAGTSTPVIISAKGTTDAGQVVDVARAFATGESSWVLEPGTYTFTMVPPVNADGSTYSAPSDVTPAAGTTAIVADLSRIEAASLTPSQASRILAGIESAVARGDETLAGAAGQAIVAKAQGYLPAATSAGQAVIGGEGQAAADGHSHKWEPLTVNGDPIYVDGKPVYGSGEPVYEYHDVCSCGIDCTAAGVSASYHLATHGSDGYTISQDVPVIVGYEQIVTGYEQKLVGYEQVITGQVCSVCGLEVESEADAQ